MKKPSLRAFVSLAAVTRFLLPILLSAHVAHAAHAVQDDGLVFTPNHPRRCNDAECLQHPSHPSSLVEYPAKRTVRGAKEERIKIEKKKEEEEDGRKNKERQKEKEVNQGKRQKKMEKEEDRGGKEGQEGGKIKKEVEVKGGRSIERDGDKGGQEKETERKKNDERQEDNRKRAKEEQEPKTIISNRSVLKEKCGGKFELDYGAEAVVYSENNGEKSRCVSGFTSPLGTTISLECPQFNLNAKGCKREQLKVKVKGGKKVTYCTSSGPSLTTPKNKIRLVYKRRALRSKECSGGFVCFLRVLGAPPTTAETTTPRTTTETFTTTTNSPGRLFCADECGRANLTFPRIVGGQEATPLEYPWIAYLTITGGNFQDVSCAGAIINKDHVVTAAHCFNERDLATSVVTIFLAEHDIDSLTETETLTIFASEVLIHPDYKKDGQDTEENDIALLYLGGLISFGTGVQPICIANPEDFSVGQKVIAVGWGLTDFDNKTSGSNVLREVTLDTIDLDECITLYQNAAQRQFVNENMICTLTAGKDACSGDSGGPVIALVDGVWVLLGIVSFGNGCADITAPGVHTNVANYRDWMIEQIGGAFC